MRHFKCFFCEQIIGVREAQDEAECPACHCYYTRHWHARLNYEKLSLGQKLQAIKKVYELYGGELNIGRKYVQITRDGKLAYKIEIETGNIIGGHKAPGFVTDELCETWDEEGVKEVEVEVEGGKG